MGFGCFVFMFCFGFFLFGLEFLVLSAQLTVLLFLVTTFVTELRVMA